MELNWYSFNVATLLLDILVTGFAFFTLFIALQERAKTRREVEKHRYGGKR